MLIKNKEKGLQTKKQTWFEKYELDPLIIETIKTNFGLDLNLLF